MFFITVDYLIKEGFSDEVVDTLKQLTHKKRIEKYKQDIKILEEY